MAVANRFVELAREDGRPITLLELVKLVYFAHGWHLAFTGRPLLRERVEAWQYGPVPPSVYHAFKGCGADPIRQPAPVEQSAFSADASAVIDRVWESYGDFTGPQMVGLTHQPGTPWHRAWYDGGGSLRKNTPIDDVEIQDHFVDKMLEQAEAQGLLPT